jgi:outer membrane protein OmpA-like peptidoglycan-associated protein
MRSTSLAVFLAVSTLFSGCVALPPADAPTSRVSPDYVASGDVSGVRAFLYGKRTVLEFDSAPVWLSIRDENGVDVPFEREGRYYRAARRLDKFSLWLGTRALSFTVVPKVAPVVAAASAPAVVASAPAAPQPVAAPVTLQATAPTADDASALLKLSAQQHDEVRQAIAANSDNPMESKALNARLDRIEAQLVAAASAIVRVQFDTEQTEFKPSAEVANVLIPAAKAAERVNVRGRTDSRAPGADDPKIALGRALAARQYLVDRGVDPAKVKVFSLPAGDFLAPASTAQGKALNRRVEIELVNRRFAELRRQATTLAEAKR